jgi:hypothetical protein
MVIAAAFGICGICKLPGGNSADHIRPWREEPDNEALFWDLENLQCVHAWPVKSPLGCYCNSVKSSGSQAAALAAIENIRAKAGLEVHRPENGIQVVVHPVITLEPWPKGPDGLPVDELSELVNNYVRPLPPERTKQCEQCGKTFTKPIHDWEFAWLRCSPECADATALEWIAEREPREPVERKPERQYSQPATGKHVLDRKRPVTTPRGGTCGQSIYHPGGETTTCAQKSGHLDQCRDRQQLDARNQRRYRNRKS